MDLQGTPVSEIQSLIMSDQLLMLRSSYNELLYLYNPIRLNGSMVVDLNSLLPYKEQTAALLTSLFKGLDVSSDLDICLTDQYDSTELPDGSLAFHRVVGPIISDSRWWFSTMQLERDFQAAEANPQIAGHFFLVKSPGGDAYYLDEISKTLRNATKPIYVFIRQVCASAAYYIGCHATVIKANTQNDIIGSIGTKVSFLDWESYYEKEGLKKVEYRATNSKLKDKKFNDLLAGKPQQFIKEDLDPLNEQFMGEVMATRPIISKFDFDNPVLQGETFRASIAMSAECGLIDGTTTLQEAVKEAHALAQQWIQNRNLRKGITKLL